MIEVRKIKRRNVDTGRRKAIRACTAHLGDLRHARPLPPADVALRSVAIPRRLPGEPTASYCSSPARLCAELAE